MRVIFIIAAGIVEIPVDIPSIPRIDDCVITSITHRMINGAYEVICGLEGVDS